VVAGRGMIPRGQKTYDGIRVEASPDIAPGFYLAVVWNAFSRKAEPIAGRLSEGLPAATQTVLLSPQDCDALAQTTLPDKLPDEAAECDVCDGGKIRFYESDGGPLTPVEGLCSCGGTSRQSNEAHLRDGEDA